MLWAAILCASAVLVSAQDVRVYSELTRIDPFGNVVKADRGDEPREILSPAVPRNAYSTFRVVISAAPGTEFTLHAGSSCRTRGGWQPWPFPVKPRRAF